MHQHFRTVSNRLKVSESIPSGGHVPTLGIPCKQKSRSECRPGMRTCFFAAGWFQRRGAGAWRSHTAANPTFVAWSFCDTLRAVSNRPYFCSFFPDEHPKERSYLMTKKQKKTLRKRKKKRKASRRLRRSAAGWIPPNWDGDRVVRPTRKIARAVRPPIRKSMGSTMPTLSPRTR